jgi:protein tyrosine phosphatase (PTP) superfamily phosphohydrolase (DUF442 family)
MVGFFSGTAVLLWPAGWLSAGVQRAGWEQATQNLALKVLILVWFLATVPVTLWLVRRMFRGGRPAALAIPLAATMLAGAAVAEWMNPAHMLAQVAGGESGEVQTSGGAHFLFGPYPDRARLAELKEQGVIAVVSLQHPAVPIEVPGIAEERRVAAEMGIRFIHAPMLPWISDNEGALQVVRGLVRSGKGKYYVHCGLGRDRSSVVQRLVESMGGRPVVTGQRKAPLTFADRKRQAEEGAVPTEAFERGKVAEVEPGVWMIPHPNDHEMFGYMLAGQVKHVVSALDPADPEQRPWVDQQRRAFAQYNVPVTFLPLSANDGARAAEIVKAARGLPRPVAVIVPRTPVDAGNTSEGTEVAATLRAAFAPTPR